MTFFTDLRFGHHETHQKGNFHSIDKELSQIHTKKSFDELKNESGNTWVTLPKSVNGTLIYFILVESNNSVFSIWDYLKALFFVGFPVYFTFYLQGLLLFTIWLSVPSYTTDANVCSTSSLVQLAVIGIYMILLIPSGISVLRESFCILRSSRVAFDQEEIPDNKVIYSLINSDFKKMLTFFLIVVPEALILCTLWYVGSGFILTSKDIGDIILNSVAIAFIMDIDNFCVEAFQSEAVTERASTTLFETTFPADVENFTNGIPKGFDLKVVSTFTNVKKVLMVIAASGVVILVIRGIYCM